MNMILLKSNITQHILIKALSSFVKLRLILHTQKIMKFPIFNTFSSINFYQQTVKLNERTLYTHAMLNIACKHAASQKM